MFKVTFFILIISSYSFSQQKGFNVLKDGIDNYSGRLYEQDEEIILISNFIDIINKSDYKLKLRIDLKELIDSNVNPLYYYKSLENKLIVYCTNHLISTDGSLLIYSFYYDISSKQLDPIDTLVIPVEIKEYLFTNIIPFSNSFIAGFSNYDDNFEIDTARFISLGKDGYLEMYKMVVSDTSKIVTYNLGYATMIRLHNLYLNHLAIEYFFPSYDYTTIVDSNFKMLSEFDYVFNRNTIILPLRKSLSFPTASSSNDSIYYASGFELPRSFSCFDHAVMKVVLRQDEGHVLAYKLISFPEQYCKEWNDISSTYNKQYFVCSTPSGANFRNIRQIKNEIYITFLNDTSEIWHKAYGGDYAFIVTGILSLDSCHLLVSGGIYDYYNNGNIQSFYTIIDCNGNIVNSNIELKVVDPTFVYPNPTSGDIWLNSDHDITRIDLFDLQGRIIKSKHGQFLKQLDLQDQHPGTYLVKIYFNGKYKLDRVILNN